MSCKVFKNVFRCFVRLAKSSKTFFIVLFGLQSPQKRFSPFCSDCKVSKNVSRRFVWPAKSSKTFLTFPVLRRRAFLLGLQMTIHLLKVLLVQLFVFYCSRLQR